VLSELIKVFLIALAAMTALMVVAGVAQEAIRQGLGPGPIARLIPYILPNALRFAVPGTMLFAACTLYGRMTASNEVVALKALGISPATVLWPALVLSFLISLVAVWLNDVAVSWGRVGVQRVVVNSVEEIAYGMLRTQRSYSSPRFAINVKRVDGRTLVRPIVSIRGKGDDPSVTITAEKAELRADPRSSTLSILMTNGVVDVGGRISFVFPGVEERVIPLTEASRKGGHRSPSHFALREIPDEITRQRAEIAGLEETLAADAAFQIMTGEFDQLENQQWQSRDRQRREALTRLHRLQTEPWRRWANGFSCFFFVLVGAPLAMSSRHSEFHFLNSFFFTFLPILLIYYPLMAYGVDRAKSGAMPSYSVWLGNAILLAWGYWLYRKAMR